MLKAYCEQGADIVAFEGKRESRGVQLQVIVMNDIVVIALVKASELCPCNFEAHVGQIVNHSTVRTNSCSGAADCSIGKAIQNVTAVTLRNPP